MPAEELLRVLQLRTYIDTFAGCGGLSLGLRQAGWHGIFAVEKDPMAFETFSKNFLDSNAPYQHFEQWPKWFPQTAQTMESVLENSFLKNKITQLKGQVSLVSGGPPCQGFSVGGARREHDPRNQLVYRLLEFIKLVEPPLVLIENVEGILRAFKPTPGDKKDSAANCILRELDGLGYSAGYTVVNAAEYGVPQLRKRVIIIGISKTIANDINPAMVLELALKKVSVEQREQLGLPTSRYVTVGEALHDLAGNEFVTCPDAPKFKSAKYITAESTYAKLMRRGIPDGEIPNSHRFSEHGPKVLKLYTKIHQTQAPGRMSKEFLVANGTASDKKVFIDPSQPATTITTHPDEQIHYKYPRNITVREMARLQSFPDDFWICGRYTLNGPRRKLDVSRNAQVGNAIPPLLGMALGGSIDKIISIISDQNSIESGLLRRERQIELFG